MQASAVTAALGLLRKVMPDLQSVDTKGKIEGDPGTRPELNTLEYCANRTAVPHSGASPRCSVI
jgi:hypothetical protein